MAEQQGVDALDLERVRGLVRRVLDSGGTDLSANEELKFLQDLGDPFAVTATTDPATETSLLHQAFAIELKEFIDRLLADERLNHEEAMKLRSAVMAASGSQFQPDIALAPFEETLRKARL